jgi:hypothetical protein
MTLHIAISPVVIHAPQSAIWAILADFDRYPEWNAFTPKIEGTLEINAKIILHVQFAGKAIRKQPEKVTDLQTGSAIAWGSNYPAWFLKGTRWQVLETHPAGSVTYRTWETYSGLMGSVVYLFFRKKIMEGFEVVAKAFKDRAEQPFKSS